MNRRDFCRQLLTLISTSLLSIQSVSAAVPPDPQLSAELIRELRLLQKSWAESMGMTPEQYLQNNGVCCRDEDKITALSKEEFGQDKVYVYKGLYLSQIETATLLTLFAGAVPAV